MVTVKANGSLETNDSKNERNVCGFRLEVLLSMACWEGESCL